MKTQGQTAMEYLLIVVVAISVIVGAMVFMQAMEHGTEDAAAKKAKCNLCSLQMCSSDADCKGIGDCDLNSTCSTAGFCQC
jgi:hypothetical protein